MLRRKAKREHSVGLGAFEDRRGSGKKQKLSKAVREEEEEEDEVEEKLGTLVFGKQTPSLGDRGGRDDPSSSEEDSESEEEKEENEPRFSKDPTDILQPKRPAWEDDDDKEISVDISAHRRLRKLRKAEDETTISGTAYSKRLRTQFEKLAGQPEWAVASSKERRKRKKRRTRASESESSESESESEDEQLLQRTGNLLAASVERLPKGILEIKKMKDANREKRAGAVVKCVEFHPTANVILTAGFNKTLDLFQVDGQVNPKLQSVHIEKFPIKVAHFTRDGTEVVMISNRRSYMVYDMMAGKITRMTIRGRDERYFQDFVVSPNNELLVFLGKDGYMPVVSNKTKQWVADLKMNGNVRSVAFTPDSRFMLSTGSDGQVYVWDMSSHECVHRFVDDGCTTGLSLAVSPDGTRFACGADSGVVNIYDEECLSKERPKPLKALMNLTTAADLLCFNSTSEILAIASNEKKKAMRLVHVPSLTVFSNWPSSRTALGYVSAVDISPRSRYLAVGNDKGKAMLYRLNHYHRDMLR